MLSLPPSFISPHAEHCTDQQAKRLLIPPPGSDMHKKENSYLLSHIKYFTESSLLKTNDKPLKIFPFARVQYRNEDYYTCKDQWEIAG